MFFHSQQAALVRGVHRLDNDFLNKERGQDPEPDELLGGYVTQSPPGTS